MARRIHDAGFDLVVWNRDRAKSEAVTDTGARVAGSPAEAAAAATIVLTSLADDAALEAVYLGDGGIVAGIRPGSLAIDTSTVDPESIRRLGDAVETAGAGFVDCPVSGTVSTVESGMLTIMAGGDPELIDRARPVLDSMSQRIVPVGPLGSGAACKLAVNGLVHGLNMALSEALVLAERAGIDRETAYEVFAGGAGGAPFVQYKRAAYEDPEHAVIGFSLDLVAKDLELITALGRKVGAPMRQAELGLEVVREIVAAGMGDRDLSAIAVYLRNQG